MIAEISRRWADAPLEAIALDGRWARFSADDGPPIYLQQYRWDDETRPLFLVVRPDDGGGAVQERFCTLDEALWAVQALCAAEG